MLTMRIRKAGVFAGAAAGVALLSAGALVLPANVAGARAQDDSAGVAALLAGANLNGITVQGTGAIKVRPDIARLSLGVQTENKSSQDAVRANATKTDAVIRALKGAGVPNKDLQTSNFSVYPQYDYANNRQTLRGYQVQNTVSVVVRKIDTAGSVLDAALNAGANNANGISFELDDDSSARDQALAKAVADGLRKAKTMARAAGLSGMELVSVQEGTPTVYRPVMMMARAKSMDAEAATPVQAGENTVSASVSLRFRFAAKGITP